MSKVQLDASTDDLDALHRALDRTRESTEQVKVSRKALAHLLFDHRRLVSLHQNKVQEAELSS